MIFIRRHGKGERSAKAHLAHRMYCIHKGLRSATVEDGPRGAPRAGKSVARVDKLCRNIIP